MEDSKEEFKKKGLGIAAISNDSVDVLRSFSQRKHLRVPLLSDPDSKIIRAFGILNDTVQPGQFGYGIPFPGSYWVDRRGIVVSKFFEEDYRERYAMGTVYTQLFGSPLNTRETVVQNERLTLKYFSTADSAAAGNRLTLIADITLKRKMHVYAPEVRGYKGIEWKLADSPHFSQAPPNYPRARSLYLRAIKETVPVYENTFRIVQDIDLSGNYRQMKQALGDSDLLLIEGELKYQACDDKICYLPQTVPLKWTIRLIEPDRERVPERLRRK
ncbi:MAG: redoxin domain-containing protein [Acidobacteria bacterium]|nr:redoxin domain-containing protein [Acidobacteriota bacterium]MCI0625929.1 redoxin domain-containing protein [Acidobacteriota bacterium]MCI0718318.1 redoxin domain-containing protein [Acidobacteriota bacterium]